MTAKTCTIPGCIKPLKGHGLCGMHYWRWRKYGDPGSAETLRGPKPLPPCSAPDCERACRSPGAAYCDLHYFRLYRNGQLDPVKPQRKTGGPCSVDGCDGRDVDSGMCAMHATRMRRHGDPAVCILSEDRKLPHGPDNPAWMGDEVSYEGAHSRVDAAKGKAADYACTDCGKPAKHWSYDHADPNERIPEISADSRQTGPYSADPGHYVPRCISCHKIFDLTVKRGAA